MPNAWNDTVEAHRRMVREAILDTTAELVAEQGPLGVTMVRVAERTGIGRATLYKYFPDAEAILLAWHERQVAGHMAHLAEVRDQGEDAGERLETVLEAFALNRYDYPGGDGGLATFLHRGEHIAQSTQHFHEFIRDLLAEGVRAGQIRDDVAPGELASYCLHALTAASSLSSRDAVRRLVAVILNGLRPGH